MHLHEKKENSLKWHGAEIEVTIEGNWTTYRVMMLLLVYFGNKSADVFNLVERAYFVTQLLFSQKLSVTCAKWQLSLLMQSFFSDISQKFLSKLDLKYSTTLLLHSCFRICMYIGYLGGIRPDAV